MMRAPHRTEMWETAFKFYTQRYSSFIHTNELVHDDGLYTYRATVGVVHDGDTLELLVDLGFNITFTISGRLLGCNAIELANPGGIEARDHLRGMLPPGTAVLIRTAKVDKFGGRYDVAIVVPGPPLDVDLVQVLITQQWAAPWNGQGTKPVPPWPRTISP